jgi:hypothetical protein
MGLTTSIRGTLTCQKCVPSDTITPSPPIVTTTHSAPAATSFVIASRSPTLVDVSTFNVLPISPRLGFTT